MIALDAYGSFWTTLYLLNNHVQLSFWKVDFGSDFSEYAIVNVYYWNLGCGNIFFSFHMFGFNEWCFSYPTQLKQPQMKRLC